MGILLSGDADFIPALNLVKKLGKEVRSVAPKHGYSSELKQVFRDSFLYLDKELLEDFCLKEN